MGAFDDVAPIIIPRSDDERRAWGWEAHEQVILKGSITVGDQEYVTNRYGKVDGKGNTEVQMGTGRYALLDRMIVSWTFQYNGQPVMLSPANIKRLPAHYSNHILEVIDSIADPMKVQAQEDFLDSVNGPTVESSSLMSLPQ
jgi:hypothetical protein